MSLGKYKLVLFALTVSLVAGGTARAMFAQDANPGADCYMTVVKDGTTWTRQGTGWLRTVGQDTYSMANYSGEVPQTTKTLNCSTNEWAES
jgi:hypothetical protein